MFTLIESNKKFKIKYTKSDGETVRRFGIVDDNCRGFGNRQKDSRPFLHYYDLDKKGYRYATNWEIKEMKHRTLKALPEYLQPKILSAVAYVNECAPNLNKAVERINTIREHLSDKEVMWVMSLLTFEKLLELVKDSDEFNSHVKQMKARTIQ